jgi:hypothetical protein
MCRSPAPLPDAWHGSPTRSPEAATIIIVSANLDVLLSFDPCNCLGDKGYVGDNMITPFKKPQGGKLLDWQKEFNTQVNKIRYVIEQVIANFKTWRIMHTDYRRPLATFPETISAVVSNR